jgi:hypothetical protein
MIQKGCSRALLSAPQEVTSLQGEQLSVLQLKLEVLAVHLMQHRRPRLQHHRQ